MKPMQVRSDLQMGSSHFSDLSLFGLSIAPEVPGLVLLLLGGGVLVRAVRAGRQAEDDSSSG